MVLVDPCSGGLLPVVISGLAVSDYDIAQRFAGSYVIGIILVVDVFEAGDSGCRKTNLKLGVLDGLLREGRVRNAQGGDQQCKRANAHRDIASPENPQPRLGGALPT